jgi:hypothetical protein
LRDSEVEKFRSLRNQHKSALALFLSDSIQFQPFQMEEVTFNIIGPYCLPKQVQHNIRTYETYAMHCAIAVE